MTARPLKRPRCYAGCEKPSRPGLFFCSNRCGAEYAEQLIEGNHEHWCPPCRDWKCEDTYGEPDTLMCGHAVPKGTS